MKISFNEIIKLLEQLLIVDSDPIDIDIQVQICKENIYVKPVLSSIWILYPIEMYNFLKEDPRSCMVYFAFDALYNLDFSFPSDADIAHDTYFKLKKYIGTINVLEKEEKMMQLLNKHAIEINDAVKSEFSFDADELIRNDMLLWFTSLACALSNKMKNMGVKAFDDKILELALVADKIDDLDTLSVIYHNYFNEFEDDFLEFRENLDEEYFDLFLNEEIDIPFTFEELMKLVSEISDFPKPLKYGYVIPENQVTEYEILSPLLKSIWLLYPILMYSYLRDNPRENMIPIASKELFHINNIIFPEDNKNKLPELYWIVKDYIENKYSDSYSEVYNLIDKLMFEYNEILMNSIHFNEDEIKTKDNLFWFCSFFVAYLTQLDDTYDFNKGEKIIDLAKIAVKFEDISTKELIYDYYCTQYLLNKPEFDEFYDSIEKDILNIEFMKDNPSKINHSFVIIICGIDKIIQVTHHAFIKDIDDYGEIVGKYDVYWHEVAELFSITSDNWQRDVSKYTEKDFDKIVRISSNKILNFIKQVIKEFKVEEMEFYTNRKILTDFEKVGIPNSSGLSKKWRRKFGKKLIKSLSFYIKKYFKNELNRVDLNEEQYVEENKSDEENYI